MSNVQEREKGRMPELYRDTFYGIHKQDIRENTRKVKNARGEEREI